MSDRSQTLAKVLELIEPFNKKGVEVAEATRQAASAVTIIASPALAQRYTDALALLGQASMLAPEDCVAAGHWRLARAAGLI